MKTYIFSIRFLLISCILFSIGLLIDKNQLETDYYEIDIEKFENVLHKKEQKLAEILDSFTVKIKNSDFQQINSGKNFFFSTDFSYITHEGLDVLIYHNDTLKYWTSNLFDIEKTFSNSLLNGKVANLNNAWYELKYIDLNEIKIVGLLKIKNQYLFENEFIVNDFSKGYDLPSSLKLSKIPLSFSFEIENKDSEYIFSIVPSNTIITPKEHSNFASILYLISLLLFMFHLHKVFNKFYEDKSKRILIPVLSVMILLVRLLMIKFKLPVYVYSLDIFDPSYYAKSVLFASLGDFLINSILLVFFFYHIFKFINIKNIEKIITKTSNYFKITITFIVLSIITIYFLFIQHLLNSLVEDSNISLEIFNILSLDLYSIIAILTYSVLLGAFVYISDKVINDLSKNYNSRIIVISIVIVFILSTLLKIILSINIDYISLVYIFIIFLTMLYIRYKQITFKLYSYVLIVFITTIYTVLFLSSDITKKQKEESKLLVSQLTNERDILAELLLQDIENDLKFDETIKTYTQKPNDDRTDDKIETYIKQKYFNGYWNKYYLDVTIFSNLKDMKPELTIDASENLYNNEFKENAVKVENSNTFFLDNKDGSISYIVQQVYNLSDSSFYTKMFITLDSKLLPNELGYPELLIDQSIKTSVFQDYSYSKYKEDLLISKSGTILYNFNYNDYKDLKEQYTFVNQANYRHLIYKIDDENFIILSEERIFVIDLLITFAYLFVFFNTMMVVFVLIKSFPSISKNFNIDFKNKLILSMIFILLLSFLLIGGTTVYYNVLQYKNKHNENIQDKIQSISIRLEQEIGKNDSINVLFDGKELSYLDYMLQDISEVFFSDVNLYNLEGNLIATSRPEIFNKYLIGTRIDQKAFYQLAINNKTELINLEKIGNLEFTSAYIALTNKNNQNIAYVNVPYFIKPSVLQEEISNLLVTIINMYVMLFIVAMVVAILLSEQLVAPLRMLQNKFQKLEIGKKYEIIDYSGKDEIGELVSEYNSMVQKLEDNVNLLAKSERESAWREMAKQVAHEIKNPLTPMKLKIQFLLKSWENKDENFDKKIQEVSETVIEQIETLSKIATEFSSFAKIPVPKEELFNLVSNIENIAQLYENTENVEIITNLHQNKTVNILADKEQISRVFINLVKNAIQSIPDGIKGKINIALVVRNKKVMVSIEDNGSGISDEMKNKLFQPSFTTKSSGMGLGLSIVKNIVNSASGDIWFETRLGQGTKFYVEFPTSDEK